MKRVHELLKKVNEAATAAKLAILEELPVGTRVIFDGDWHGVVTGHYKAKYHMVKVAFDHGTPCYQSDHHAYLDCDVQYIELET